MTESITGLRRNKLRGKRTVNTRWSHNDLRDHVAERLRRGGRYSVVDVEYPVYHKGKLVYVADVVGWNLTDVGWRGTVYECKTGRKPWKKAEKQEAAWYFGLSDKEFYQRVFPSDNFILVYGGKDWMIHAERWRR